MVEDIQLLLELIEDCPSVVSIQPDVANCWYIVLDMFCCEELMTVMMRLRQCTLAGHKPFVAKPPSLGEENFPTMPHENKVEWEVTPPVQQTLEIGYSSSGSASSKCKGSDAASTATTVSSSVDLSCRKLQLHGYAAALLKPRPVSSSNGSSSNASKSVGETTGLAQGKQLPSEAMLTASTSKHFSILPAKKIFIKMPELSMPSQPILIEPPV
ncbi:hypothetical protein MPSEU_001007500 [Mayamaea pseudoterrestris]|nr:hypothetical protein MPSEU_001007500 [Mayamaea pseudoterrestris]